MERSSNVKWPATSGGKTSTLLRNIICKGFRSLLTSIETNITGNLAPYLLTIAKKQHVKKTNASTMQHVSAQNHPVIICAGSKDHPQYVMVDRPMYTESQKIR